MKRSLGKVFLVMTVILAAMSCSRSGRVIPAEKMQKIYAEMFLADQWFEANPDKKAMADTTLVYEPIFEKYGYTYRDYLATVDHYLADPERYTLLMQKVDQSLQAEADRLQRSVERRQELKHKADSISAALKSKGEDDLILYESLFYTSLRLDTICLERKKNGAYMPALLTPDTLFQGPAFTLRDTVAVDSLSVAKDSVSAPFLLLDEPVEMTPKVLGGIKHMPQIKQDEVFQKVLPEMEDESPFEQPVKLKKHKRHKKS